MPKIPKTLHYCFGLAKDFGGKPWSLVHYVCVRSAIERLKPDAVFLYYEYEPSGAWWRQTKPLLQPVKITAPREVFGNPLLHPAHRADVVRLQTLIRDGGIYLDTDVLVHRSFDELLDHTVVLGEEGVEGEIGVANAVILAAPGAPFLQKWRQEYRWFRSRGKDRYWNEHSVQLPRQLAAANPGEATVLPGDAFYRPLWTPGQLELIFAPTASVCDTGRFANHLWESNAWERYLKNLTPGAVRRIDSNFHRWARPYLADLPDDFGAPGWPERASRFVVSQSKRLRRKASLARSALSSAKHAYASTLASLDRVVPAPIVSARRRQIFQRIYKDGLWGASPSGGFFSGTGSRGEAARVYVEKMSDALGDIAKTARKPIIVVDLGCGDFEIGRKLLANVPAIRYVGCDIVPELIAHHVKQTADARARFEEVDIVAEDLPAGDVCLLRQVLQHLSNADIKKVLAKLRKFDRVFVTEGYPVIAEGPINPDKTAGYDVRFDWRSGRGRGVELAEKPFNVAARELFRVQASEQEVIVTFELLTGDVKNDHSSTKALETIR